MYMLTLELEDLFFRVITSWQVIVATVAIILYIFLVGYVARKKKRVPPPPPPVKSKKSADAAKSAPAKAGGSDDVEIEEQE